MEETMDKILQRQRLTYELLAAMFGDGPIREDENDRWPNDLLKESA